jgi:hypothetical protein
MTIPDLHVEVVDDDLIVALPGTCFRATYRRKGAEMERTDCVRSDLTAPISLREFVDLADQAAADKGRELGWIV